MRERNGTATAAEAAAAAGAGAAAGMVRTRMVLDLGGLLFECGSSSSSSISKRRYGPCYCCC